MTGETIGWFIEYVIAGIGGTLVLVYGGFGVPFCVGLLMWFAVQDIVTWICAIAVWRQPEWAVAYYRDEF